MEGYSLEEYATKIFNDIKIGDKDKDNGVLILLALLDKDNRMVKIETGYGAEGFVPDACLLYTSDAADDGESVDLGGRRIIKKKKKKCFFFFSFFLSFFFFQAEDGIRDQPRSRGLGDVYKRQTYSYSTLSP